MGAHVFGDELYYKIETILTTLELVGDIYKRS